VQSPILLANGILAPHFANLCLPAYSCVFELNGRAGRRRGECTQRRERFTMLLNLASVGGTCQPALHFGSLILSRNIWGGGADATERHSAFNHHPCLPLRGEGEQMPLGKTPRFQPLPLPTSRRQPQARLAPLFLLSLPKPPAIPATSPPISLAPLFARSPFSHSDSVGRELLWRHPSDMHPW